MIILHMLTVPGIHKNDQLREYYFYNPRKKHFTSYMYNTNEQDVYKKICKRYINFIINNYPTVTNTEVVYFIKNPISVLPIYEGTCIFTYDKQQFEVIHPALINVIHIKYLIQHALGLNKGGILKIPDNGMFFKYEKSKNGKYYFDQYILLSDVIDLVKNINSKKLDDILYILQFTKKHLLMSY